MTTPSTPLPIESMLNKLADAESQIDHLRRDMEHSNRLATIGTIAAGISHEVNNLLTPTLHYAYQARAAALDPASQVAMDSVIAGIESAAQILQAVLGFSAVAPIDDDRADIAKVLADSLKCLARDPIKDRIAVRSTVQPDTWVGIQHLALQQVFLNLLLNACRAMRSTGGEINLSAVQRSDGTTAITVADTGPGFPEDVAGKLFKPFTAAQAPRSQRALRKAATGKTSSPKAESHGLGLSICKQIIESAGGSLAAASSGHGATFTIIIPSASVRNAKAC